MNIPFALHRQLKVAALFILLISPLLIDSTAQAGQGFLASISPARLELKSEPGKVVRGAFTIENMGKELSLIHI